MVSDNSFLLVVSNKSASHSGFSITSTQRACSNASSTSWQARAGEGFDKGSFVVDWERQVVTCPAGKESISWLPNTYPQNGMVFEARFSRKDCTPCPCRSKCTKSEKEPRIIGLLPREQHEELQATRREQGTEEF